MYNVLSLHQNLVFPYHQTRYDSCENFHSILCEKRGKVYIIPKMANRCNKNQVLTEKELEELMMNAESDIELSSSDSASSESDTNEDSNSNFDIPVGDFIVNSNGFVNMSGVFLLRKYTTLFLS